MGVQSFTGRKEADKTVYLRRAAGGILSAFADLGDSPAMMRIMCCRVCFVVALGGVLFCAIAPEARVVAGPAGRHRACWNPRRLPPRHCCCCDVSPVDDSPNPASIALALGDKLREEKDWTGAITAYTRAVGIDPKCAEAFCGRGRALANKGDLDASLADLNEAIRLDPESDYAYSARGGIFAAKGQFDRGFSDLETAIRLNPTSAYSFGIRGAMWAKKGDCDRAISDLSESIRLDPDNQDAYLRRSWLLAGKHQFRRAVADLDAAIRLNPTSAHLHEVRGVCLVESGDYDGAIADFQSMLRLNPKDPAARYKPQRTTAIAAADLEHGRRQVEKMLHDRPPMAQLGTKAEPLYQWAARKFAGEDVHELIFWDSSEPMGPTTAEHKTPMPGDPGRIRLSAKHIAGSKKGQPRSFEEMWQNAVFELHNIAGVETFRNIQNDAVQGRLSKNDYVTKMIECESKAADSTRAFYIHVFLPFARQWRLATRPIDWYLTYSESGSVPVLSLTSKMSAYWQHYEKAYDGIALCALINKGDWNGAIGAAREMEKRAETSAEKAEIHALLGRACTESKQYDKAIAEFGRMIECKPDDAKAYECRAYVYCVTAQHAKAIADYSEAIRLTPEDATLYESRAAAFLYNGQYDKSAADCSQALKRMPNRAMLYVRRSAALAEMRRWDQAIADAKKAIALEPDNIEAHRVLDWLNRQRPHTSQQPATSPQTTKPKHEIEFESLGKDSKQHTPPKSTPTPQTPKRKHEIELEPLVNSL
jgi:tetratricopeptide (TPR) repeat protein